MVELVQQKKIHLIVDEAHATGVIGKKGEGLVQDQQLQDFVFARTHTFGKACGCHGAVIVGSAQLKQYLLNFARSFVFTTALPEHSINIIKASYDTFPQMQEEREQLHQLISLFQQAQLKFKRLSSLSPIQIILIPGNAAAKDLALQLQKKGLDLRAILYPSVPKGLERLRIVLHAFNTREELALLIAALS
jgi:8-amino-7-oxononanoate synthase